MVNTLLILVFQFETLRRGSEVVVCVITSRNRDRYPAQLEAMFRDRKRVFVDELKWKLDVVDGQFERDAYDTDQTIYLVSADSETGKHICSMRLMPTTGPHLLKDVFPALCDGKVPIGEDVWEVTRLCTSPSLSREQGRTARRHLSLAMIEFGLLYGISRLTMVTHLEYLSRLLAVGWECRPLGTPKEFDGHLFGAMEVSITPTTLKALRIQFGGRSTPVLELQGLVEAA